MFPVERMLTLSVSLVALRDRLLCPHRGHMKTRRDELCVLCLRAEEEPRTPRPVRAAPYGTAGSTAPSRTVSLQRRDGQMLTVNGETRLDTGVDTRLVQRSPGSV